VPAASLRSPPPSASLTQFYNVKMIKVVKAAVPPPSPLFFKKRGAIRIIFSLLFPLSNSFREGEIKG